MNKSKYNDAINGALYPYDFLERQKYEPEWSNLKKALNDTRVTNIAISAPYDTGKTSFVLSFFTKKYIDSLQKRYQDFGVSKSYKELRYKARNDIAKNKTNIRFVNLPNFFLEKEGKESEIELEKDIIGQLLFNSNSWRYPDSKMKRLKEYPLWGIGLAYILIAIFILLCIAHFNYKFNSFDKIFQYAKSLSIVTVTTLILGCVLTFFAFYVVIHYFSKISWTLSGGFGDKVKLTSQFNAGDSVSETSKDLLLLYGDELQYFFKKSKVKYVILEDLDRYNQPLIFQRLHQLNINLNKGRQHIVFIYTLKDSVFNQSVALIDSETGSVKDEKVEEENRDDSAQLKSKFFDYIIPLMPNTSFQNSKQKFKEEIGNYPGLNDNNKESSYKGIIDEKYLDGLGNFIFDPREIVNIISEVATYADKFISETETVVNSLPKAFSPNELLGVVVYKNEYPEDFENIIKGTSRLNCLMQNRSIFYEAAKEGKDSKAATSESASEAKERIEDSKYGEVVKELIERYPTKKEFEEAIDKTTGFKDLDFQEQDLIKESINFVYDERLIRYLLLENLLDPTYCEYITSSAYSLSMSDRNFVQNVLSYYSYKRDQKLDNAAEVEKELDAAGANYRFAYSSDLMIYLTNSSKNVSHIEDIMRKARRLKDIEVILTVIKRVVVPSQQFSLFMNSLVKIWPEIFSMNNKQVFQNVSDTDFRLFIQKTVEYLFQSDDNKLFNILTNENVLENVLAKDAFIDALKHTQEPALERPNSYKFKNLNFATRNSNILFNLVKNKWYEENYENFCIIFEKIVEDDFAKLVKIRDNLNLSNEYVLKEVFQCYQDNKNATFNDIKAIKDFLETTFKPIDDEYRIKLLQVYLNSDKKFDDDQKDKIITLTNLINLIDNNAIDEKLLIDLIEENKLVYKEDLFKEIYDNNEETASKYELKFENEDNISFFFYDRHWSFIMKYLIKSKYQRQLVSMIDGDANLGFTESECTVKQQKVILKYTGSEKVIRKIMQFTNLTSEVKGQIINKIFSDTKFKMQFSKEEISNLIFDNPDYIESWWKDIDGSHEISTPKLREKYKAQLRLLYDNVPQDFKKKGTNKFIFRKNFKSWLA